MKNNLLTLLFAVAGLVPAVAGAQEPVGRIVIVGTSIDHGASVFEDGVPCYQYVAAKEKIFYIEESFRANGAYVCIRYLYDEEGKFVAASTLCEEPSAARNDLTKSLCAATVRSKASLRPHETFNCPRFGIQKDISAMAEEAMETCCAHMEKQTGPTPTQEKG